MKPFKYNVDANLHQSVEGALEKQDAKNNTNLNGENMSYQNEIDQVRMNNENGKRKIK